MKRSSAHIPYKIQTNIFHLCSGFDIIFFAPSLLECETYIMEKLSSFHAAQNIKLHTKSLKIIILHINFNLL